MKQEVVGYEHGSTPMPLEFMRSGDPYRDLAYGVAYSLDCPKFYGLILVHDWQEVIEMAAVFHEMYPLTSYSPSMRSFKFPSGATVQIDYLDSMTRAYRHAGCQYTYIGFLNHRAFEVGCFEYMLSRLRSESKYDSIAYLVNQY